jgi:hypothetical protein
LSSESPDLLLKLRALSQSDEANRLVEKQKTENQGSSGGDVQAGTSVGANLIAPSKPELISNDKKPNPSTKA